MPTPGVLFLLRALPAVSLPIIVVYASFHALDEVLAVSPAPWVRRTALVAAFPLMLYLRIKRSEWRKGREAARMGAVRIPGNFGRWPGNVDVLLDLARSFESGYLAEPFWPLMENLGNVIRTRILWVDGIFTTEPDHIKQILATEFNNFEKGSRFINSAYSVLGVGVFNSDGEMWKFHRSMTRPFFSRERISHFELFARHADTAIACAKQRTREGYALDVQDLVARFTLDSATEFLFGRCVHSLRTELPYPIDAQHMYPHAIAMPAPAPGPGDQGVSEQFVGAFALAQKVVSERAQKALAWPLWEVWRDKTRAPVRVVRAYVDPILEEAIRKNRERKAGSGSGSGLSPTINDKADVTEDETLLDHLVKLTDDPVILKDEILNIMIAARDTTAATLTFATYMLSLHPPVMLRLRTEILEKVGPTRKPNYDDIREMKYLRAVINETLRLYPPVPFNIRESINATTFSNSNPGGKPCVSYSVFMMHRRTDLWGPDAHEFDPDRFLDERLHKYLTPNPFIFLPFNAGPRICLGQQFAYNETSFMLVRLLQAFDRFELDASAQPADSCAPPEWKNVPGRQSAERIFPKTHLTMYAFKGLWVRMHEAANEQD